MCDWKTIFFFWKIRHAGRGCGKVSHENPAVALRLGFTFYIRYFVVFISIQLHAPHSCTYTRFTRGEMPVSTS